MKLRYTLAIIAVLVLIAGVSWAALIPAGKLIVWGWSDNGAYWAFAEQGDYSGGGLAGEEVHAFVIDAAKNDFHLKQEGRFTEDRGYEEEAQIKKAVTAFKKEMKKKLRALGVRGKMGREVYKKKTADWVDHDMVIRQYGQRKFSFKHQGNSYDVALTVKKEGDDPAMTTKSGFTVRIRKAGAPWKTLQADKTLWRTFREYRLVYASVAPTGDKIALVVEAVQTGFEGAQIVHYKGVTGALP
ncbi:MAG TPA: DUF2259 domain-containing protein [bacterium]|nr:DUF2259 domain-containing protein [bacterium]